MKLALAAALVASFAGTSFGATLLGIEPPPELIVVRGGLEWVYAGPCAPIEPSCGVVQFHHDFRLPTEPEWIASFTGLVDLEAAFTGKCGSPYFNVDYDHCDESDITSGSVWGAPFATEPTSDTAEAFLVRGASAGVPEPSSLLLLGTGVAAILVRAKKARR